VQRGRRLPCSDRRRLVRGAATAAASCALLIAGAPAVHAVPSVEQHVPASVRAAGAAAVSAPLAGRRSTDAVQRPVRRYTVDLVLATGPGGRRDRTRLADLRAAVRNVDAFYNRNTGGLVRFSVGRTHGWATPSQSCSLGVPRELARRFDWTAQDRSVVVAYQPTWCSFLGAAELSGRHVLLTRSSATTTMAHEIGHILGLGHSNLSRCSFAFSTSCSRKVDGRRSLEYGDGTDLMGGAETAGRLDRFDVTTVAGTLNPRQLRALDIPFSSTRVSLTSSTPVSVTLRARVDRLGWSAASLVWGGRTYWLSYLAGTGVDDPLAGTAYATRPFRGEVVVHTKRGRGTLLIPVSRSAASAGMPDWTLTALPGGRTLEVRVLGPRAVLTVTPPEPARPASVTVEAAHGALDVTWTVTSEAGTSGYVVEGHSGLTVVARTVAASVTHVSLAVPRAGQPYRVRVYPLRAGVPGTPREAARSVASLPALVDMPASVRAEGAPDDERRWRVVLELPPAGWDGVRMATVVVRNLSEPGSFDLETGTATFDSGPVVLDQYETGPGPYRVTYTLVYRDGGTYSALVSASYLAPA
jgi:hypothetical protein